MPILVNIKYILILFLLNNVVFAQNKSNDFVVVLDAGHGGHDPGKHSKYGFKEKDIALKITLKVGSILEKKGGIKVIYTRKKDKFLELRERARIANQADADLFVSIHCNAHHSQAYGTETFVLGVANTKRNFEIAKQENEVILLEKDFNKNYKGYDPNKPESLIGLALVQEEYVDQSILLASLVEDNFVKKSKRKSRGVKQASLWVMHNTYMPSVLIETGFVTNKNEGPFLNSKKGQQNISSAIANAIAKYKSTLDYNIGDAVPLDVKEEKPLKKEVKKTKQKSVIKKDTTKVVIDSTVVFEELKVKQPELENATEEKGTESIVVSPMLESPIIFKVQIAAGSIPLEAKPKNFKGLQGVSRIKIGAIYKYYYGETSEYKKIEIVKEEARNKGYTSAFVVAYKNGESITVKEALKTLNH